MSQDRESGARANFYGRENCASIADAIGARKLGKSSNECELDGQLVTIRSGKKKTTKFGVMYETLKRVNAVVAASEQDDGSYEVFILLTEVFRAHMKPTRSTGPSSGEVGTVNRTVFKRHGTLVARVRV